MRDALELLRDAKKAKDKGDKNKAKQLCRESVNLLKKVRNRIAGTRNYPISAYVSMTMWGSIHLYLGVGPLVREYSDVLSRETEYDLNVTTLSAVLSCFFPFCSVWYLYEDIKRWMRAKEICDKTKGTRYMISIWNDTRSGCLKIIDDTIQVANRLGKLYEDDED